MKLSDFDFELPQHLIATRPARPRSSARLLHAENGEISDRLVTDLASILRPGDRLVLNNTKVIPARLVGRRVRQRDGQETTARVEFTLLSQDVDGQWQALAKPGKRLAVGETVQFSPALSARVCDKSEGQVRLDFNLHGDAFSSALADVGSMPLPPYIATIRAVDPQDDTDYQSVFARHEGAVAAPTASLHFDEPLLAALRAKGVETSTVTLHVGAGTFLPVKVENIETHKMHAEWGEITASAATEINDTRATGGRIICVGTTALRLCEAAAVATGTLRAWQGDTDIFIRPGFEFRAANGLITNFHLPKSTLLMLVSALMGRQRIRTIYDHAISHHYRFFSYGDGSLLIPDDENNP